MNRIIEEAEPPESKQKKPSRKLNPIEESYYILSKPMVLTNFFVNKPRTTLGIVGIFLVVVIAIDLAFNYFATSVETNRDFLIWDDVRTI